MVFSAHTPSYKKHSSLPTMVSQEFDRHKKSTKFIRLGAYKGYLRLVSDVVINHLEIILG